jgi:hypothetical protein
MLGCCIFYEGVCGHLGLFVGSEVLTVFSPEKDFVLVLPPKVSQIENRDVLIRNIWI